MIYFIYFTEEQYSILNPTETSIYPFININLNSHSLQYIAHLGIHLLNL